MKRAVTSFIVGAVFVFGAWFLWDTVKYEAPQTTRKQDVAGWCTYANAARVLSYAADNGKYALFSAKGFANDSTPKELRSTVLTFIRGVRAMSDGKPATAGVIKAAARIDEFVADGCKEA